MTCTSASERFLRLLTREQDRRRTAWHRLDHGLPFRPIKLSTCLGWGTCCTSLYLVKFLTLRMSQGCKIDYTPMIISYSVAPLTLHPLVLCITLHPQLTIQAQCAHVALLVSGKPQTSWAVTNCSTKPIIWNKRYSNDKHWLLWILPTVTMVLSTTACLAELILVI